MNASLNASGRSGHIASFRPPVTAFCGGPSRTDPKPFVHGIDIRSWEAELKDYFVAEGITQDNIKISEAKRAIAPNKGDARHVVASSHTLKNATSYDSFIKELKELYVPESQTDPIGLAVEVIDTKWEKGGSFRSYLAEVNEALTRLGSAATTKYGITWHEETARVMAFGAIARRLGKEDRALLAEKVKPSQPVIRGIMKVFAGKGGPSTTPEAARPTYAERVVHSGPSQGQGTGHTQGRRAEPPRRPKEMGRPIGPPRGPPKKIGPPRTADPRPSANRPPSPPQERCWACRKPGHKSWQCPDVRPDECWHCQEMGHMARYCPNKRRYSRPAPNQETRGRQAQPDFRVEQKEYDFRRRNTSGYTYRDFPSLEEVYPRRYEGRNAAPRLGNADSQWDRRHSY